MFSFKDEIIKHYIDEDLQVTVDRNPSKWSTGNGLLHTGLFMCLLYGSKKLELQDIYRFKLCVDLCEDQKGLYDRNKGRNDKNAHDDSIGVAAGSVIANLNYHVDILDYGLKNNFVYDNVDHSNNIINSPWAFRARFPFLILWYFLINKKFKILLPIMLVYLIFCLKSKRADAIIMNYCKIESLTATYKYLKWFRNWWVQKSNLTNKFREYFNKPGEMEHPIIGLSEELK